MKPARTAGAWLQAAACIGFAPIVNVALNLLLGVPQ
jgi:hypothetical protein